MLNQPDLKKEALRYQTLLKEKIDNGKKYLISLNKFWPETGLAFLVLFFWFLGIYLLFFSSPLSFPTESIIRINKNTSIAQVGTALAENKMIHSELVFKTLARFSDSGKIIAGDYKFKEPTNVFTLIRRFTGGEFGIEPTKITILEGENSREIANLLDKKLPTFDKETFIELAEREEGKLFPDTYFIKPSDDEKDIVDMMVNNFEKKVGEIKLDIMTSNKSLNEILTMASIIEIETRTPESRRLVSGILWNRIKKDMKLQVDAVFPYIMNKYSLQLTMSDLQVDSPYNTYKNKGLPPTPVGNPGLDSIKAAIEPTKTKYLYYLSDKKGNMYYAETYQTHMVNRKKYIGG